DLAGEKETFDVANLQRRLELLGIHEIVLDRISVARDHRVFESRKRTNDGILHVGRKRRRNSVEVKPRMTQTLWFDKDVMALFVGEANDLIFDRRTVARAGRFDLPRIHRRAM